MNNKPSTRNLGALPDIATLRRRCQALALLDAIICQRWDLRYYSFNAKWSPNEMMASMRDGGGDDYFILFDSTGAIIKGFVNDCVIANYFRANHRAFPGVIDHVPPVFSSFAHEPAFSVSEATFCIWRQKADLTWSIGPVEFPSGMDPDGSQQLLDILDGEPITYQSWAEGYHGHALPMESIRHVCLHQPITPEIIRSLNSECDIDQLNDDIEEIGYGIS